jgi:hypothetical protein
VRRPVVIAAFFILGVLFLWAYFAMRLTPGLEAKGGAETWMPWLSLVGAIVSLFSGLATLGLKVIELRTKLPRPRSRKGR